MEDREYITSRKKNVLLMNNLLDRRNDINKQIKDIRKVLIDLDTELIHGKIYRRGK